MKKVISLILTLCMVLSFSGSVLAEETYKSGLYNYTKADTATKVGDVLNFKADNVERFHIGKVNEEQLTMVVDISDPDDVKKFYNKFASLEFTDNSDVEDAITILMRVKINDEIHTGEYYTHYGIFSKANDANAETIEGKYISEQELYKIIDDLGYEWSVNNAGASPLPEAGGSPLAPPSDWAAADIDKAKALNITNDDVIYRYRMSITREEFCELAYNYISEFGKDLNVSNSHKFNDTDNVKVETLSSLGIIYGKSETEFAPNDLLTREEAATILERLINIVHPGLGTDTQYITFVDSADISDWAMCSIQTIYKLGIMQGVGNNNFAPKDNYTTEQAIVTLVRVYATSGVSKNDNGETEDKVSFYNINSHDNTRGEKIEKQEDGWYKLPSVVGSFINYDGEEPMSVTAYFTPAGTDMEQCERQVGFTELLWTQNPVSVKLTFAKDDTLGHLHFVFGYENGATTRSAMFNVLIEH